MIISNIDNRVHINYNIILDYDKSKKLSFLINNNIFILITLKTLMNLFFSYCFAKKYFHIM